MKYKDILNMKMPFAPCPKCGSSKIEWLDSDHVDGISIYEGKCENCSMEFSEEFRHVFLGNSIIDPDNVDDIFLESNK